MAINSKLVTSPLLRVPPFPGAGCKALVDPAKGYGQVSDEAFAEAKVVLSKAKVGGSYWGAQPALPQEPYILIQVRNAKARARLCERLNSRQTIALTNQLTPPGHACDPWHLLTGATEVYADIDDELLLLAALLKIATFDANGLAIDADALSQRLRCSIFGAGGYVNPFNGEAATLAEAISVSTNWRTLIDSNRPIVSAVGFAGWKRPTAAPLLWAGSRSVPFVVRKHAVGRGEVVAAWKARTSKGILEAYRRLGATVIEVEDGFIRSLGLGANCVPPLSLVVDWTGIYFDPQRSSDLEVILQHGEYPAELIDRAQRLRALIVGSGISKYAAGREQAERRDNRRHLLVPGQVENDRSVQCGGGEVTSNVELLRRARQAAPNAYIIYKPHPDVEAGHRAGAVPDSIALSIADEVSRDHSITALIDVVDEVHVNTSLAGFEALMRNKEVTTHGVPFYAGWGLTRDLGPIPERRSARRSLDELVAAALLVYPRYLDPVSGLPCTAEVLVHQLAKGDVAAASGPLVTLRRLQGFIRRSSGSRRGKAR